MPGRRVIDGLPGSAVPTLHRLATDTPHPLSVEGDVMTDLCKAPDTDGEACVFTADHDGLHTWERP